MLSQSSDAPIHIPILGNRWTFQPPFWFYRWFFGNLYSSKRILFPLDLREPAMVRYWPVSALLAAEKSLLVVRREEKSGLIAAGGSEDGSNSSWDFVSHL
jgi:hypothetical protein